VLLLLAYRFNASTNENIVPFCGHGGVKLHWQQHLSSLGFAFQL